LPPKVVADIVARTDGVPLFLEEITQAVVENRDSRAPTATSVRENTSALPLSLQASLLSRLDRLGRAREIAEVAAAIGREFTSDLLALVVEDARNLQGLLDRLVGSGLVLRRGGQQAGYLFKHELIRDAAYSLMTRDKRRVLHLRIAEALEKNYPETATNHPEILAWHYTECRLIRRAVELWLDAGRQKLIRSAMAEALKHLERGIELIGEVEDSPWRVEKEFILTIAKGKGLIATQGYAKESTRETFEKARILSERMGEPPQLLAVLHGLWTHELLRGNLPSAQKQAAHVLDRGVATDTVHKKMWLLMGHRFSGVTNHPMGNFRVATDLLKGGLEYYDPDPKMKKTYADLTVDDPCVVMKTYLSWSLMCQGEFAEARRYSAEAVAEAREMAHVYTLAHALNGAAFVALTINTPDVALRKLDELASILSDNGIAYYEAVETIFRGWCFAAMGEFEKAMPLLSSGMDAYRETGSRLYLSGFLRMSAEAHCWAGRCDIAMDMIQESTAVMESTTQWWDQAEILRVQAMLMRSSGDRDAAEDNLRKACAVARKQGARLWELRASCDLTDLLLMRGEAPTGHTVLTSVLEKFAEQTDVPDLLRARTILGGYEARRNA
jgi:tetratricopeptide (TPR) repeat protein